MKLKAIIIDDEQPSRDNLNAILHTYFPEVDVAGAASNTEEAKYLIDTQQPQLLFLDVELGPETGFQLLQQYTNPTFEVIFITAYDAYAVKAFKTIASDYLLKPIDIAELEMAIKKIAEKIELRKLRSDAEKKGEAPQSANKLKITTSDGTELIPFDQILYLQSINYYTNIVLVNGREIITSRHLKDYESHLAESPFYRIHNSYMVNVTQVRALLHADGGQVVISNGKAIKISRRRKEAFLRFVHNFDGLTL
jgi:two-component system LytT family response regulator